MRQIRIRRARPTSRDRTARTDTPVTHRLPQPPPDTRDATALLARIDRLLERR